MITIKKEEGVLGSRYRVEIQFTSGLLRRKGLTDTIQTECKIFLGKTLWSSGTVIKNINDKDDRGKAMIQAFRRAADKGKLKKDFRRILNRVLHERYVGADHSDYEWSTPIEKQDWTEERRTMTLREDGSLTIEPLVLSDRLRGREYRGVWVDEASRISEDFWKKMIEAGKKREGFLTSADLGQRMHESFLKGFMGGAFARDKSLEEMVRDFLHRTEQNEEALREDVERTIEFLEAVKTVSGWK